MAQRTFRPDETEYSDAQAVLKARDLQVTAFLRAALRWVADNPDEAIAVLEPVWPPPRAVGRPARAEFVGGGAAGCGVSDESVARIGEH